MCASVKQAHVSRLTGHGHGHGVFILATHLKCGLLGMCVCVYVYVYVLEAYVQGAIRFSKSAACKF